MAESDTGPDQETKKACFLSIFDLDETLVDLGSAVNFDEILLTVLMDFGIHVPDHNVRSRLWSAGKDHGRLLHEWGIPDVQEFWKKFDARDFEARADAIENGKIKLFPETLKVLKRLEKDPDIIIAILTNTPRPLANHEMDALGLSTINFECILALNTGEFDQFRAKPDPWGLTHIMNEIHDRMSISFNDKAAYFGDLELDMIAAKNAGIPGVQVVRNTTSKKVQTSAHAFDEIDTLDCIDLEYLRDLFNRWHQNTKL